VDCLVTMTLRGGDFLAHLGVVFFPCILWCLFGEEGLFFVEGMHWAGVPVMQNVEIYNSAYNGINREICYTDKFKWGVVKMLRC